MTMWKHHSLLLTKSGAFEEPADPTKGFTGTEVQYHKIANPMLKHSVPIIEMFIRSSNFLSTKVDKLVNKKTIFYHRICIFRDSLCRQYFSMILFRDYALCLPICYVH